MHWHLLFKFAPLLAILAIAAAIDLRSRRIPNWLTGLLLCSGLMQTLTPAATTSLSGSLLGLLTGAAISLPLFLAGIRGGGDVKLVAGVGAWVGPMGSLLVLVAAAIAGMLLVLLQCLVEGRLWALLSRTALVCLSVFHMRAVGAQQAGRSLTQSRLVGRPLPYAVPVLLAALVVLLSGRAAA